MMNLYSGTTCPFSQRCRIVLYEKGMDFQVIDVDLFAKQEDIAMVNPYGRVPVLVERDLILYEPNIINEYIDERFPHPQLMPADPIMRARARQLLITMEREVFAHIEALEKNLKTADKAPFDDSKFKPGDEVASIMIEPFTGDRGDIATGAKWSDGKWTIEIARKLVTGSKTDVNFGDLAKPYGFGIAFFDNAQVRHAFIQEPLHLQFSK